MVFEQAPELNKYLFSPPKFCWSPWRSKRYRLFFPFLLLVWIIFTELLLAHAWVRNDTPLAFGSKLSVWSLTIFMLVPLMLWWGVKWEQRRKRAFQVHEAGIKITANTLLCKWSQIKSWHIEPVPGAPGLQILVLDYATRKRRRRWSIILKQPDQTASLELELEQIRQKGTSVPLLTKLGAAPPARAIPRHTGIWPLAIFNFFLFNSVYLLIPGVALSFPKAFSTPHSGVLPQQSSALERFIAHHFSTVHEFRNFLLISGVCLASLGVPFYVWSRRIASENQPQREGAAIQSARDNK